MQIPATPPDFNSLFENLNSEEMRLIMGYNSPMDSKNRYVHWNKLRFLPTPEGFTTELWWLAIKQSRKNSFRSINIDNHNMDDLKFANIFDEKLFNLDKSATGKNFMNEQILNSHMKDTYLISSLIEESIRSSQLEGATTTRKVAKDMIQKGRDPRDTSEKMIFNNYEAMQFIRSIREEELTPNIIKELHRIVTKGTLKNEEDAGDYRVNADNIHVVASENAQILYTPPDESEIESRVQQICDFANNKIEGQKFIHPIIRAILLHFLLSYTHPFVDGNGRTARALFYWLMIKQGYWLIEFISISKILKNAPAKYGASFLETETDENDLTYFIDYQLEVIERAIKEFYTYYYKKIEDIEDFDKILEDNESLRKEFNVRQIAIIKHALKHPGYIYTIKEHSIINNVVYDTARKDLLQLAEKYSLLMKMKEGKTFNFFAPMNLKDRLDSVT